MNKFLLTVAGLMFLSTGAYAQQERAVEETFNADKTINTRAAIVCDNDTGNSQNALSNFYYFDGVLSNETTTILDLDANGQVVKKTTIEKHHNTIGADTNTATKKITTVYSYIAKTEKVISQEVENLLKKTKTTTNNEYDKTTANLLKKITCEVDMSTKLLDSCIVTKYSARKTVSPTDTGIEAETSYEYNYDSNSKISSVFVKVWNKTGLAKEERFYEFSGEKTKADKLKHKLTITLGDGLRSADEEAEATFIIGLIENK